MSEKREGWDGWANKHGSVMRDRSRMYGYTEQVWVAPLDPDGPKPGETWDWQGEKVTIMSAPWTDHNGRECVVVWREGESEVWEYVDHLSPISPTRTVTVEVTESEENAVRCNGTCPKSVIDKLAEALEDE